MRFTTKRFPILRDIEQRPLGAATGLKKRVALLARQQPSAPILSDFKKFMLHFPATSNVYYIASSIFKALSEDEQLQKKLLGFLKVIQPEAGVLLFPTLPKGQLFTYACYQIENEGGNYQFRIGLGHKYGIEIFSMGNDADIISSIISLHPVFPEEETHTIVTVECMTVLLSILFKQYAPIETKILKNEKGTSNKTVLNKEKYLNDAKVAVQIIDSTWFTNIIRKEGFWVRGHFGLRACGPGRTERKLTWIDTYEKSGYNRAAGRLKE